MIRRLNAPFADPVGFADLVDRLFHARAFPRTGIQQVGLGVGIGVAQFFDTGAD